MVLPDTDVDYALLYYVESQEIIRRRALFESYLMIYNFSSIYKICPDRTDPENQPSGSFSEENWDELMENIKDKKCTPFIGAGACYGILPLAKSSI